MSTLSLVRSRLGLAAVVVAGLVIELSMDQAASAAPQLTDELQREEAIQQVLGALVGARVSAADERLRGLELLQSRGQASWREVAEQRVIVESLRAQYRSSRGFEALLAAVRRSRQTGELFLDGARLWSSAEVQAPIVLLSAEEGLSRATGDWNVARVDLRRQRLRLEGWKRLYANGHASAHELQEAADRVTTAEALVERLSVESDSRVESWTALQCPPLLPTTKVWSLNDRCLLDRLELTVLSLEQDLTQPAWPVVVLTHDSAVRKLIELRQRQFEAVDLRDTIAAELEMRKELLERLLESSLSNEPLRREIEFAKLDVDFQEARQHAASGRLQVMRLEEWHFVEQALAQIGGVGQTPLEANHVALWDLSESFAPEAEYVSSPPNSRAYRPLAAPFPRGVFSFSLSETARRPKDSGPVAADQLRGFGRSRGPATTRFHSPTYADYYQFGVRRTDRRAGDGGPWSFGAAPWYLPGSSTNFR